MVSISLTFETRVRVSYRLWVILNLLMTKSAIFTCEFPQVIVSKLISKHLMCFPVRIVGIFGIEFPKVPVRLVKFCFLRNLIHQFLKVRELAGEIKDTYALD